jgi:hypothetical protein
MYKDCKLVKYSPSKLPSPKKENSHATIEKVNICLKERYTFTNIEVSSIKH